MHAGRASDMHNVVLHPSVRRTTKKGYEEVHVPALKPKPFLDDEKLRKIEELPDWSRQAFGEIKTLNRIQSRCVLGISDLVQGRQKVLVKSLC